jgi:hypothetical protein
LDQQREIRIGKPRAVKDTVPAGRHFALSGCDFCQCLACTESFLLIRL